MKLFTKIVAGVSAVVAGASLAIGQSLAYTTGSGGFPVVESSDTATMLAGVGSAGTGILNFMTSNWTVIVALAVLGAIVGLVMMFGSRISGAVRGR